MTLINVYVDVERNNGMSYYIEGISSIAEAKGDANENQHAI